MSSLAREAAQRHFGHRLAAAKLFAEHIGTEHIAGIAEGNDLPAAIIEHFVKPDEAAFDSVDVVFAVTLMKEVLMRSKPAQRLAREDLLHAPLHRPVTVRAYDWE